MNLSSRYDMEVPIDQVFAELVNFDHWERAAMRRGADLTRADRLLAPGPGMAWNAAFRYRGKDRKAQIRLERLDAPAKLELKATSTLADAAIVIDLLELSARRTRMALHVDIRPKTLAAKLYVQSLRLAKGRVEKGFQSRTIQFGKDLEARLGRPGR